MSEQKRKTKRPSKQTKPKSSSETQANQTPVNTDMLQLAAQNPEAASPDQIMQLQRMYGNQAVIQMVRQARDNVRNAHPPSIADATPQTTDATTTVQRLPARSEVESDVGKSGHYLFVKTSWEKFLNALDKYNKAEKSGSKTKQLNAVVNMQKHMVSWLESNKRKTSNETKKASDDKKRDFLYKLRPNLKILYYELSTKAKTVDVAESNAARYKDENEQTIKEKLLKEKLDNSKKTIQAMVRRLNQADLTYNFEPKVLDFLMSAPDFKTIWQLTYQDKTPSGVLPAEYDKMKGFEKREAAERWLGYDPFQEKQRENRPAYLGINVLNNSKGAAPLYGRFYFIFKDVVKSRSTYTPFDTFEMISNSDLKDIPEKVTGSSSNLEALIAYNDGVLKVLGSLVNDIEMTEKEVKKAMGKYIEAQVHGALSVNDIEALVVDYPKDESKRDTKHKQDAAKAEAFIQKYPHVKLRYRS